MEDHLYTCKYCSGEFLPKRRRVQKYCSDTCRNKDYHLRQQKNNVGKLLPIVEKNELIETVETEIYGPSKQKVEKMSWSGVGNAAAGTAAVNILKNLVTPEHQKAATKGDLNELKSLIKGHRYFPIKNLHPNHLGQKPYFDIQEQVIVYFY